MAYTISKDFKSPDMNDLIDEFESPIKYNFPSPPKTKPKIVKKKYVSAIDTNYIDKNDIKKIAKNLGLNQLSIGEIEQLEKYVVDQKKKNNIEYGVAINYLLQNIKSNETLTFAIIKSKIQLRNDTRIGKGTKRRRKTRNKKTIKGKKKPRKKTYKGKRK